MKQGKKKKRFKTQLEIQKLEYYTFTFIDSLPLNYEQTFWTLHKSLVFLELNSMKKIVEVVSFPPDNFPEVSQL